MTLCTTQLVSVTIFLDLLYLFLFMLVCTNDSNIIIVVRVGRFICCRDLSFLVCRTSQHFLFVIAGCNDVCLVKMSVSVFSALLFLGCTLTSVTVILQII